MNLTVTSDPSPFVSVLLVNYNGLIHLDECLSSICSQDFGSFEVVFVDNASRDGSADFVRTKFPEVKVVDSGSNLGFAGGNNFGLPFCRGRFVFFLNNDTRLEPGALLGLAQAAMDYPDCRVFACFMLNYRAPALVDNAGEVIYKGGLISGFSGCPADRFTQTREVAAGCGGAVVYARSLLDQIGGFDEKFFLLYEDVDLSMRARHQGERILFLPNVRVLHKGSASIGGRYSQTSVYYSTRNYLPCFVKSFPALTLLKCSPGILLSLLLWAVKVILNGQSKPYFLGLKDSIGLLRHAFNEREKILRGSKISRAEFERTFRPGWFRERLAIKRGHYEGVP